MFPSRIPARRLRADGLHVGQDDLSPASVRPIVSQDEVEELESTAADDLACPEDRVESRPLTLLTRVVEGCGHQRVYAYDPLRERWIVASVEKR